MMNRLRDLIPRDFLESEIAEIKEHRIRFGIMVALLMVAIGFWIADNVDASGDESLKLVSVDEAAVDDESDEAARKAKREELRAARIQQIIGLAKADEEVQLINPFAVDLPTPPPEPVIESYSPPPVYNPPPMPVVAAPITPSMPPIDPKRDVDRSDQSRVVLTLKGTAGTDDKRMAIVRREVVSSKEQQDQSSVENHLLKVGEEIDGRRVVEIERNFVAFDDGGRLEFKEQLP